MDPDVHSRFRITAIVRVLLKFRVTATFVMSSILIVTAIISAASMTGKNTTGAGDQCNHGGEEKDVLHMLIIVFLVSSEECSRGVIHSS